MYRICRVKGITELLVERRVEENTKTKTTVETEITHR